ncbi:diadenosine tetraphosphate hydrolase [Solimonas fluminis]|uniref:Diadenosine tetraphosphate hydrolase n=1 Tax=Solimonas fluminis TaxID=2086571 RepID=A0A2S5TIZ3_9GAMM|nr:HIT domain-containing protein [Solimonas fluminis]PPE74953.1 diadenosine tetraphosphate hydrolase [Solimonas fluminis]
MTSVSFTLHPRLNADCIVAGDWPLSRLLLMNDSRYPWYILVPRRNDVREIHELDAADQTQLFRESMILSRALAQAYKGDKLNIAALGNVVPQLHMHHIVRFTTDAAWPSPVWGKHPAKPYSEGEALAQIERLLPRLELPLMPLRTVAPAVTPPADQ